MIRDKHNREVKRGDLVKSLDDGLLYQVLRDGPVPLIWDLGRTPKDNECDVEFFNKKRFIRWTEKDA